MTRRSGERTTTEAALAARATLQGDAPSGKEDEPGGVHPAYHRMVERALFCRRNAMGTEGYRNAFELALPRLGGEGDDSYFHRHGLVGVNNGFARAANAFVGWLNEQPTTLEKNADPKLVQFIEDVDRAGTGMTLYDIEIDHAALIDSFALGVVDHTKVDNPEQQTEDEEERSGAGPYWLMYKLEDVLDLRYETVNGVRTLVFLSLREVITKKKGRFGRESVTRYRVYENNRGTITCEVWKKQADGSARIEVPLFTITNQTEIPCAFLVYGTRIGKFEFKPALLDLAYLTEEHYRLKNGIRNLETVGCVPTRFRVGAKRVNKQGQEDQKGSYPPMPLGVREVVEIPFPPANVHVPTKLIGWDSPDTAVLEPASKSLIEVEKQMAAEGASIVAPDKNANETATGRRIDTASQRASLGSFATSKRDFHDKMIYFTAKFLGVEPCKTSVNTNFTGEGVNAQMLSVLKDLYVENAISLTTLLYFAKHGKFPDTMDPEDEAGKAVAEAMVRDKEKQKQAIELANATKPQVEPEAGAVA